MDPMLYGATFATAPIAVVMMFLLGGRLRDRRRAREDAREMDLLVTEARIKGWI